MRSKAIWYCCEKCGRKYKSTGGDKPYCECGAMACFLTMIGEEVELNGNTYYLSSSFIRDTWEMSYSRIVELIEGSNKGGEEGG